MDSSACSRASRYKRNFKRLESMDYIETDDIFQIEDALRLLISQIIMPLNT